MIIPWDYTHLGNGVIYSERSPHEEERGWFFHLFSLYKHTKIRKEKEKKGVRLWETNFGTKVAYKGKIWVKPSSYKHWTPQKILFFFWLLAGCPNKCWNRLTDILQSNKLVKETFHEDIFTNCLSQTNVSSLYLFLFIKEAIHRNKSCFHSWKLPKQPKLVWNCPKNNKYQSVNDPMICICLSTSETVFVFFCRKRLLISNGGLWWWCQWW